MEGRADDSQGLSVASVLGRVRRVVGDGNDSREPNSGPWCHDRDGGNTNTPPRMRKRRHGPENRVSGHFGTPRKRRMPSDAPHIAADGVSPRSNQPGRG